MEEIGRENKDVAGGGRPDKGIVDESTKKKKRRKKAGSENARVGAKELDFSDLLVLKGIVEFLKRDEKKDVRKETIAEFRRLKRLLDDLAKMMRGEDFQSFFDTLIGMGIKLRKNNAPYKDVFKALADKVQKKVDFFETQIITL